MPRVKQMPLSEAHPRAQTYYDAVFNGRCPVRHPGTESGSPGHWWTTLALRPYVFDHALDLPKMYGFFADRSVSLLASDLRELAIGRMAFIAGSQFVFSQRCKALRRMGLSEEQIDSLPSWAVADIWTAQQRAVLAYTDAVVQDFGRVPDGVFSELQKHLGDEDIMELTYFICSYMQHAAFIKALRLEFDDVPERVIEVPLPPGKDLGAFSARYGVDKKA